MELLEKNLRPRDIVTRKAFENAAMVVAATGGSTNAALHLPAMANEAGIKFDLFDVAEIFKKTPYIASMKPGGKYVAKDMWEAGGVPMLMRALLDAGLLHGDLHDGHGQDHGGESQGRRLQSQSEGDRAGEQSAFAHRRRGGAERQSRARRRDREDRGPEAHQASRARRGCSTAKRIASISSRRATTKKAMCW